MLRLLRPRHRHLQAVKVEAVVAVVFAFLCNPCVIMIIIIIIFIIINIIVIINIISISRAILDQVHGAIPRDSIRSFAHRFAN
jgi:hypothetical protein